MEQTKQERLKISNDLLDNLLVGVKLAEYSFRTFGQIELETQRDRQSTFEPHKGHSSYFARTLSC